MSRIGILRKPNWHIAVVLALLLIAAPNAVSGQSDGLLQINDPIHNFLVWQHLEGRIPHAFLSHQPLSVYEAREYLDSVAVHRAELNNVERELLDRFRGDTTLTSASNFNRRADLVYKNGVDLVSSQGEDFSIQVNPLLYWSGGYANRSIERAGSTSYFTYQNTRGLRFSGAIGKNVSSRAESRKIRRSRESLAFRKTRRHAWAA